MLLPLDQLFGFHIVKGVTSGMAIEISACVQAVTVPLLSVSLTDGESSPRMLVYEHWAISPVSAYLFCLTCTTHVHGMPTYVGTCIAGR